MRWVRIRSEEDERGRDFKICKDRTRGAENRGIARAESAIKGGLSGPAQIKRSTLHPPPWDYRQGVLRPKSQQGREGSGR